MKKLILAFVALAFAFAISSCCDQSYCPGNMKCSQKQGSPGDRGSKRNGHSFEYDNPDRQMQPGEQPQERSSRRW